MPAEPRRRVIALVTDAIYPYHKGGKEMRYDELSRRLGSYGHVDVYTMNWWQGGQRHRSGDVTFHALTPLLPLYVGGRRSVLQAFAFALGCLRLLWTRFDVVEADHMPYFCLFTLRLVTSIRRKRLVVCWHEVWGPAYWRDYLGPAGAVGWMIERLAMRLPDHIIADAEETAERLRAQLGPRASVTVVAPVGVDLQAIARIPADAATVDLVTVGRLLGHKRIDLLLDAIAELARQGERVTSRVIGDGPDLAALRERATELGIADQVEFRTDVHDHDTLFSLVKAARVFAFPSEREGFGVAVLEALACGLPVVATSAPDNLSQHLAARSSSGVVAAPEPVAFAAALSGALGRARAVNGSRATEPWLQEYDWTSLTRRVAEVMGV